MTPGVYIADVSALGDEQLFGALYQLMDEERRKKIDSCCFAGDKRLSLGVGTLQLMARRQYGPDIRTSLSHSGIYAMCACHDKAVGCDVEQYRPFSDKAGEEGCWISLSRCLHEEEARRVLSRPDPESRRSMFYRIWTMKESYMKLTGLGLELPLRAFSVVPGDDMEDKAAGVAMKVAPGYTYIESHFYEYGSLPGYGCALAVEGYDGPAPALTEVDLRRSWPRRQ